MSKRVHYHMAAVTGRTSCAKPNLQQVPRRVASHRVSDRQGRFAWLYGMPRYEARRLAKALRAGGVEAIAALSVFPLEREDLRRGQRWEVRGRDETAEATLLAAVYFAKDSASRYGSKHLSKRRFRRVLAGLHRVLGDAEARAAFEAAVRVGARPEQLADLYLHELARVHRV